MKINLFSSICAMLYLSTSIYAQSGGGNLLSADNVPMRSVLYEDKENETFSGKKNLVKIGLFSLFGLDPHLSYERVINDNSSLNVHLAFINLDASPTVSRLNDENIDTDVDLSYSRFAIIPEYRFYLSKKPVPHGFYIAPYLRYARQKLDLDFEGEGTNSNGVQEDFPFETETKIASIGGGLQLGAQWIIKEKVAIDWGFLGLGFNAHNIDITIKTDADNIDFQSTAEDLERELQDAPLIGDKLEFSSDGNSISGEIPAFGPSGRFYLKIGYLF